MLYTKLIKKAISFSTQVHETDQKQKRKGKDIAYIIHPLSVGLILARAGASEEIIVAGILHDTLEDSLVEKKITKEMLVEEFNEEIANLVVSVTEQNKELPWEVRKQEALEHIRKFSQGSLLVKSADILNNASELLEDYEKIGSEVFVRFNASREKIFQHYQNSITAIIEKWNESPLTSDLLELSVDLYRIQALEEGNLAYVYWNLLFIIYEINRIYKDSAVADQVKEICKHTRDVITIFNEDHDIGVLQKDFFDNMHKMDSIIKDIENKDEEKGIYMLLITHIADSLNSFDSFLKDSSIKEQNDEEKVTHFTSDEYLKIGEIAKPFWEKGISEQPPKFVIFTGGTGSGKTTIRRHDYPTGYVHFEFGEILNAIKKEFGEDNPKLGSYASLASDLILRESLEKKKNIVIEIIGDNKEIIETLMDKLKDIGYETTIKFIFCDPVEAYTRHIGAVKSDPDYLSVYFTQEATLSFLYQQLELGKLPAIAS